MSQVSSGFLFGAARIDAWIAAALALQAVDARRAVLLQQTHDSLPGERALRLEWIRLARLIQSAAPIGGPLSADDAALLFAKLDAEAGRCGRRAPAGAEAAAAADPLE